MNTFNEIFELAKKFVPAFQERGPECHLLCNGVIHRKLEEHLVIDLNIDTEFILSLRSREIKDFQLDFIFVLEAKKQIVVACHRDSIKLIILGLDNQIASSLLLEKICSIFALGEVRKKSLIDEGVVNLNDIQETESAIVSLLKLFPLESQ